MRNLKIIVFFTFVSIFGTWYYYNEKIDILESEVELLTQERNDLRDKVLTIENGLMDFGKQKYNKPVEKTPNKKDKEVIVVTNEPKTVKVVQIPKIKQPDDVSLVFPNRTGQDLVNSLKLKTTL